MTEQRVFGGLPPGFTSADALALGRSMFDVLAEKRARAAERAADRKDEGEVDVGAVKLRAPSVRSLRRLADTVKAERVRADAAWEAAEEALVAGQDAKSEMMRLRAEYHERTVNLICGAMPEVRKLL